MKGTACELGVYQFQEAVGITSHMHFLIYWSWYMLYFLKYGSNKGFTQRKWPGIAGGEKTQFFELFSHAQI